MKTEYLTASQENADNTGANVDFAATAPQAGDTLATLFAKLLQAHTSGQVSGLTLTPSVLTGTYDDGFTGSSLGAKWSRQGLVSGDHTYQTGGGSWMTMNIAAGATGSIARSINQAWTSTTNATITCRIAHQQIGSAYPMFGPFFTDSSGNGIGMTVYNNTSSIMMTTLASWVYSASPVNVTFGLPNYNLITPPHGLWFKLRKAGTTYYASFSFDGMFWGPEVSTANATAMTRIGLGLFLRAGGGSDYGAKMHFDFFKVE